LSDYILDGDQGVLSKLLAANNLGMLVKKLKLVFDGVSSFSIINYSTSLAETKTLKPPS